MPFETQDEAFSGMINVSPESLEASFNDDINVIATESPSFMEAFGASILLENEVGAAITMDTARLGRRLEGRYTETGIDYFKRAVEEGYNPEQLDDMFFVENPQQYSKLKLDIDTENLIQETLRDAGGKGIASMFLAGALSPVGYFTGATALNLTMKGAKTLDVAKGAATAGFVASAVQEGILSGSQATRTAEQSAINIGASTVLSGVLGGGVGAVGKLMGKKRIKDMEKATQKHLDDPNSLLEVDDSIAGQIQHESIGAARTPDFRPTLQEQSIYLSPNPVIKGITQANLKTFGRTSLSTRLLQSPSVAVREFSEQIGDIALAFNKNVDKSTDIGVLSHIRLYQGDLTQSSRELKKVYKEYLKAGETDIPSAFKRITPGLTPEGKVNYKQFKEMVSDAYEGQIKNTADIGDDVILAQHVIRASERAGVLHKRISKEAFDVGMLEEGQVPKGSSAWLNHVWVPEKVIGNLERARAVFTKHFNDGFRADVLRAKKIAVDIRNKETVSAKDKEFSRVTLLILDDDTVEEYISESVDKTIRNITSAESQIETLKLSPNDRGPFKERIINIPYREISFMLERDFEELMERAARTSAAEIELTRKFGSAKLDDDNIIIMNIKDEYKELIDKAPTDRKKIKLADQMKRDLSEVSTFWDLIRGTYRSDRGSYDDYIRRGSAALRAVTFLSGMGQVVISSALDPLIIARANGYSRLFKVSVGETFNREFRRLNKKQIRRIGKGMNVYNANRLIRNFELGDPMARGSAFERGLHNLTKSFGNLNGINYWNDAWEKISLSTNSMRMYENLGDFAKNGKLSKEEEFWMNQIGVGKEIRGRMSKELSVHGFQTETGLPVFNTQEWDDKNIARKVEALLNKKIGSEVVAKSVGDAPIFAESPTGKALFQFMSFGFAANNKIFLAGLQQADARWLATEVNFLLGGVMVYAAQQWLSGKELPEDNTQLFLAALDRSPELMLPMMVNKITDDMGIGLSNLTDNAQSFRPEKLIGTVLGANYNTIRKMTNATLGVASRAIMDKEPTKRQIKDIRQSMFYNNIFYIKPLVNEWEKLALDSVEKAAKRRRRKERRQKGRR